MTEPTQLPVGGDRFDAVAVVHGSHAISACPHTSAPGLIHAKLAQALREMKGVAKDGRNQQQNFNFRSIDDIAVAAKHVFEEVGIFVVPSMRLLEQHAVPQPDGKSYRVMLEATYTFFAEDGSYVSATTIGEGADTYDKATNKAMSAAFKYALMQTLCIGDPDEDGDASGPPAEERSAAPARQSETRAQRLPVDDERWARWEADREVIIADDEKKQRMVAWLEHAGINVERAMSLSSFAALTAFVDELLERAAK